MKKLYSITYEEWKTGKKEVKKTLWTATNETDVFLDFIDSTKWILKIEEV